MSRPVRILGVLLAVSLAINIFVLGVMAGRAWQRPHNARGMPAGQGEGLFRAGGDLGEADHSRLRWLSREQRRALVPRFKALRAARREAEAALRREPFERAELERTLGRVRAETQETQQALHALLAGRADGMTAEQRSDLARLNWGPGSTDGSRSGHRRRDRGDRESMPGGLTPPGLYRAPDGGRAPR